jgi:thiol-disulfide isomerase/thioredoxin
MIDRRGVIAGGGVSLLAPSVRAAPEAPLFVSGPLAKNSLATSFHTPTDALKLPDIPLIGEHGPQALSHLPSKTWLISLWAEWCAPCLMEAGDLAALGQTYGGRGFGVIFVLTGSNKKLNFAGARDLLGKCRAGGATLFVEADGHGAVMQALATQDYDPETRALVKHDRGASLPCNLLVDRRGRIRGRSFGAMSPVVAGQTLHEGVMHEEDKARVLTQRSTWATPVGQEFIAALASGALEKA